MLKLIFVAPDGKLRAIWRATIYYTVGTFVVVSLLDLIFIFAAQSMHLGTEFTAANVGFGELRNFFAALICTAAFALYEQRRVDSYGLALNRAFGWRTFEGAAAGIVLAAVAGDDEPGARPANAEESSVSFCTERAYPSPHRVRDSALRLATKFLLTRFQGNQILASPLASKAESVPLFLCHLEAIMNAFTSTPNAEILVDGSDPEETVRVKRLIGYVGGQTTDPTLVSKNPEGRSLVSSGQKFSSRKELEEYKKIVRTISRLDHAREIQ